MNDTRTSDASAAPPPGPPPPPPPPGRPPFRRDPDAGYLGGVAAGVANHLDVDVVLVRIGFVVVTILTQGLGALAYLLGWILIPQAPAASDASARSDRDHERRGASFWFGVVLLTLGSIWFVGSVTGPGGLLGQLDAGIVLPLLLLGLGVALWRRSDAPTEGAMTPARSPTTPTGAAASAAPGPPPPRSDTDDTTEFDMSTSTRPLPPTHPSPSTGPVSDPASDRPSGPMPGQDHPTPQDLAAGPPPAGPPAPPSGPGPGDGGFTPPPAPVREGSLLARATLGVALLTAGVLWMLDMAGATVVGPLRILSITLAIVGVGLLIGSIAGRGRSLIIVGVILLPLVLVGSLLRGFPSMDLVVGPGGSFGQVVEAPVTVEEIESSYQLGAGEFLLDLGGVGFAPGQDVQTSIQMGAGELVVTVPDDVDVLVNARVGAGELQVFEQTRTGVGIQLETEARIDDPDLGAGSADDEPAVLTIDLNAGFGDVTIERNER